MSTPSAGQNRMPPSAVAIVARPVQSFRSSRPQAEAGVRRSSEDGRVHRPRHPGHRNQDLPPWSPGHLLPYRLRQRPRDRDEDPPAPAPGKTGPAASCTKGSALSFSQRSQQRRGLRPHHRPFRTRHPRTRARRHRPNHRPEGLRLFRKLRKQGSRPSSSNRPRGRRCDRVDQQLPCCGQQSSFTRPLKAVLEYRLHVVRMQMFSICSHVAEESSNRE